MEVKLAQFTNKGMNKDLSISKSSNEFAYHNENIRITTIGKESLLSVTNEKESTPIAIDGVTKDIPNNWFRYVKTTRDDNGDYSLVFESDYKLKTNVDFNVTLQYYKQEGLSIKYLKPGPPAHPRPIPVTEVFVFSKRYMFRDRTNDDIYFIYQLHSKYGNINDIYIINDSKDYISLTDTIYVKCSEDDENKSIKINSVWYKPFVYIISEKHFVVECFRMHGHDDDIDRFEYVETPRTHTFTLTAEAGKTSFKYRLQDLPGLSDLLPNNSQHHDEYWGWGTGFKYDIDFLTESDVRVLDTSMYYHDDYFHYTTDKNAVYPPIQVSNIYGDYIGHCMANDYIVIFVKYQNKDYIYRINKENGNYVAKLLFFGDLKLSTDNPLETLFYYESEDIQKVYWLDGKNQPRVINIMKEDYINDYNSQFDFVPEIRILPTVKIEKKFDALGSFHSGVIQYFITYYNKFASESRIVWGSSLQYLSFEDRAGSADEFCSCSFDIKISNVDTKFDYLRLYSVKRQSLNGPLEVNIVSDIRIADREQINIVDIGANQVSIDPNILNFIGGSNFIAQTLTQKDDTLFLGNIEIEDNDIDGQLKKYISENWIQNTDIKEAKRVSFKNKCFSEAQPVGLFPYRQQINSSSLSFKTFKRGEIYRFAIQYQDKKGSWTQPIWIGDKKCDIYPKRVEKEYQMAVATATFNLTPEENTVGSRYNQLVDKYIAYRLLMAQTSSDTRSIISQGIVCPTIFNYKQRTENKPYAISSYIMRPRGSNVEYKHFYPVSEIFGNKQTMLPIIKSPIDKKDSEIVNPTKAYLDLTVEFYWAFGVTTPAAALVPIIPIGIPFPVWTYHLTAYANIKMKDNNNNYCNEINICPAIHKWSLYDIKSAYENLIVAMQTNLGTERTTLDSQDIVFSRDEANTIKRYNVPNGWTVDANFWDGLIHILRVTKQIEISQGEVLYEKYIDLLNDDGNLSDLDNETLGLINNEYYVDESIVTLNSPDLEDNIYKINQSGVKFRLVGFAPITSSYSDFNIQFNDDSNNNLLSGEILSIPQIYNRPNIAQDTYTLIKDYLYNGKTFNSDDTLASKNDDYDIYMWHHSGPLIGDVKTVTPDGEEEKLNVDVIKEKTFSTKRFSLETTYFKKTEDIPIATPEVFYEDNIAMKKISVPKIDGVYYGNYNFSLIPDVTGPDVDRIPHDGDTTGYGEVKKTYSPVDITFNSTPHAVISLCETSKNRYIPNQFYLLPHLNSDFSRKDGKDYLYYSFGSNNSDYDDSTYAVGSKDCLGIVYINKDTTKTLYEKLDDYLNDVFDTSQLEAWYIMTSKSNTNTDLPKIDAIYKVRFKEQVGERYTFYYDEYTTYDNEIFYFIQNRDYPNLKTVSSGNPPIIYKYTVNSFNGSLRCISNSADKFSRAATINYGTSYPYLFIGELYRDIPYSTLYGGYDENAIENITWIPISSATLIGSNISKTEGDTYYQRWDCVKTTPAAQKGVNNVIDITSVMIESHNCLDGRWDKNKTWNNIINISSDNYNLFNPVYSQQNNIFTYNILDDKYDLDKFKNQIIWSKQKNPTEEIDSWANISQLNSLYLDGMFGGVNKLINFNDSIIAFQDKAISSINFNNQTQVSTEQGLPIEVVNSGKVTGYNYLTKVNGCINKWSISEGVGGLYFIDSLNKAIFRFNKDGLTNLSASLGFADWSKDNITLNKWTIDTDAFRTSSDKITHDIYFSNNSSCLCYNEDTQTFTSFYTEYSDIVSIFNLGGESYYLDKDLVLHKMFAGDYKRDFSIEFNVNPEPLEDKIFTNIEYIADTVDNNVLQSSNPFKELYVYNEYQEGTTNLLAIKYPNAANKFRLWRADVPRDSVKKLDRIRNPWARFKLTGNDNITGMTTLHSITVKYFK